MQWKNAATLCTAALLAAAAWSQQPAALPAPPAAVPKQLPTHVSMPTPHIVPAPSAPAPAALPAVVPPNRPIIGLALEGGGALGMAHIGVLEWFEQHHIPIDRLAGTSMGALVGALYSTGHTPAEMTAIAESSAFDRVFTFQIAYIDSSYRRRQDSRQIPTIGSLGLKHSPALHNALLADHGVNAFLITHLLDYNNRELDYNRTPIPFRCVATDLNTLKPVSFAAGPLPEAIRASISIPGFFPPVQVANGHYLVDGGILDDLPTDVLKQELHAQKVIAVHLEEAPVSIPDTGSIVSVLNRAFDAGIESNVNQALRLADVVINIPIGNISENDYSRKNTERLIEAGRQAAEKSRAALLPYALNDHDWQAYLADRDSRRIAQPGNLLQVRVEGGSAAAQRQAIADLKPLHAQPITAEQTLKALKPIQSNGDLSATYETFAPPPTPNGGVPAPNPDTGILIRLTRDTIGPPYLLVGADVAAATSNITYGEINLRLVDQNLGGFGSELRTTARLGYLTDLSTEYYRLLTPSGLYLQPRAGVLREPVYIWANQKRVADRFQQNLIAGVEAGRTFGNSMQISAEWRSQDTRWSLVSGSGGGPYLNGTAQTGLLHFTIDKETSGIVSPQGFRLAASAGAFYHAAQSSNAPLVMLSTARTWQWKQHNIFGLTADINSYLRANVAQPFRFTLGGPAHLSASSFDEYRGTDTALTRAGYLRRIAKLPTGYGQGLYAMGAYEAGEIWSPEAHAILRQDGAAGLVAATPFGVLSLGVSVGDAGHRKVFFTLGRLF